jgi:hypothetical protein
MVNTAFHSEGVIISIDAISPSSLNMFRVIRSILSEDSMLWIMSSSSKPQISWPPKKPWWLTRQKKYPMNGGIRGLSRGTMNAKSNRIGVRTLKDLMRSRIIVMLISLGSDVGIKVNAINVYVDKLFEFENFYKVWGIYEIT